MGIRRMTRAVRHEVTRRARNAGAEAELILGLIAPRSAIAVADAIRDGRETLGRAATSTRSIRARMVERAAGSRVGTAVGAYTRRVARHATDLPLLSLPQAVLDERRGVAHLRHLAAAAPHDPVPAIRLAEALRLLERDTRYFLVFRTLWNPAAPLVAQTTKVALALDDGKLVRPAEAMLRRAYALAVLRLRVDDNDGEALHVVARVFLATGQPEHGVKPCRLAVARSRSETTKAQALYTLSLLQHGAGDREAARSSATWAVAHGCSLGWRVLAELLEREDATSTARRLATYQQILDRIESDHELAYRGFLPPRSGDLWRTVLRDQSDKAASGYQWLTETFQRLQVQAGDAIRRRRTTSAPDAFPPP